RRAYYGMLSYADDLLGRLLQTLETLRLAENTIVVVTSDHGDMLGERGLWYKMVFFERAIRVPLIVAGPGIAAGRCIPARVSHVDPAPSFTDLAGGDGDNDAIDGRSVVPLLHDQDSSREVFGEYTAEGYDHPLVMIRRGQWKFIHSESEGSFL